MVREVQYRGTPWDKAEYFQEWVTGENWGVGSCSTGERPEATELHSDAWRIAQYRELE